MRPIMAFGEHTFRTFKLGEESMYPKIRETSSHDSPRSHSFDTVWSPSTL